MLVRVRQLMSITETQYSGSDVLIVSPDSDNLSVLQAAVLGFDLRSHRDFAFAPGEARELQLATEAVSGVLGGRESPMCRCRRLAPSHTKR